MTASTFVHRSRQIPKRRIIRRRTVAQMSGRSGQLAEHQQEIYLQELVLAIYGIYMKRLDDDEARRIIGHYLNYEEDRRRRTEDHLARHGSVVSTPLRRAFAVAGRLYGRVSSWFGTRIMLRIVLSASRSASRRACVLADSAMRGEQPELQFLATLRARNEGDLLGDLRQHLINTRPRRS
ncbi:MAG: hypothetical protein V3U83_00515 [Acidobacteriota bacterium]